MEGLRGYWRRKRYQRLDGSGRRQKKNRVELATLGNTRKRRFWRIKVTPKLRMFRLSSPKKFFIKLRDAYVRMMLSFANAGAFSGAGGGLTYGVGGGAFGGFGKPALKEYDEKVLVEIYKSLMVQQQLMARSSRNGDG